MMDMEAKGRLLRAMEGAQADPLDGAPAKDLRSDEEKRTAKGGIGPRNNPAELDRERLTRERGDRLSLNAPSLNLEVPALPGYHMHWFLETNVPLALRGWYEFVTTDDKIEIPDKNIGGFVPGVQSEDLGGNRVTQLNKGPGADGQPIQFVLMKIRQEFYFDEQRKIASRNYAILYQIFKHKLALAAPGENQGDYDKRYTREAVIDMRTKATRTATA